MNQSYIDLVSYCKEKNLNLNDIINVYQVDAELINDDELTSILSDLSKNLGRFKSKNIEILDKSSDKIDVEKVKSILTNILSDDEAYLATVDTNNVSTEGAILFVIEQYTILKNKIALSKDEITVKNILSNELKKIANDLIKLIGSDSSDIQLYLDSIQSKIEEVSNLTLKAKRNYTLSIDDSKEIEELINPLLVQINDLKSTLNENLNQITNNEIKNNESDVSVDNGVIANETKVSVHSSISDDIIDTLINNITILQEMVKTNVEITLENNYLLEKSKLVNSLVDKSVNKRRVLDINSEYKLIKMGD